MGEAELVSVEEETWAFDLNLPTTVAAIADDRMPGGSQVNSDLMCSSSDRLDIEESETLEFLSNIVTGFSGARFSRLNRHPGPVLGMTADRPGDFFFFQGYFSPNKS